MSSERNPAGPVTRGIEAQQAPTQTAGELPFGLVLVADPVLANRATHPLRLDGAGRLVVAAAPAPPTPSAAGLQRPIEAAAAGDNVLVPGVAGQRIRVYHYNMLTRGAVNARLRSAATNLSGLYSGAAAFSLVFDAPEFYPLTCGVGEDLILNLSGAVGVDGFVIFTQGP